MFNFQMVIKIKSINYVIVFLFLILYNVGLTQESLNQPLMQKAHKLAQKYIIVDGHVDLPYRLRVSNFRLQKEYLGIPYQTDSGDFDYLRAKKGGLDAPFMSIYIPSSLQETGGAKELADSLINMVEFIAKEQNKFFQIAYSAKDVRKIKKAGKIALPMGMENGAPVEDDINMIPYFKKRGISYITLTHAKDNKICDSSYDTTRTWNGLSPYGYKVLDKMIENGIMVDISHVSDSAFYQTLRHVKVPVIASHSSCRKFTPGFERNMSDEMIRMMKTNGGVIMVNFGSSFLDSKVVRYNDSMRTELRELIANSGHDEKSQEVEELKKAFAKQNPKLYSDVEMVANHIDHIVHLAGIDHVGFGSDYDGVGDSLPMGLKDVSDFPNLIYVLLKRGYSSKDIKKICGENLLRVWSQIEK